MMLMRTDGKVVVKNNYSFHLKKSESKKQTSQTKVQRRTDTLEA